MHCPQDVSATLAHDTEHSPYLCLYLIRGALREQSMVVNAAPKADTVSEFALQAPWLHVLGGDLYRVDGVNAHFNEVID
jgi:hypothetical protein